MISTLLASKAFADGIRFPFMLPHCPTSLELSAPGIFAGATKQQWIMDQLAADPAIERGGTIVLALTAPLQPSVVLVLVERSDVSAIQGKATAKQFDDLKMSIILQSGQDQKAAANRDGRAGGLSFNNVNIFSTSSNANSAVAVGLIDGSGPGADFTSYMGVLVGYVHLCIPSAILLAPTSSMSKESFEKLVRSLSFE
ncbi:MAG TPA: hypothetical protein VGQ35_05635 [Dongiaceae bacterium]|nr:hypothetical protein [Dongiaceae bacterium]